MSDESWFAFTTRRIVSQCEGRLWSLDPSKGIDADFGSFKGYGPEPADGSLPEVRVVPRETATITSTATSGTLRFEFETFEEFSVPAQAVKYWWNKHPVLHKLMTTAEFEQYKAKNRS